MKPRRRKHIPLSVKLEVLLAEKGLKPADVEWDHEPPLAMREWDEAAQDTVPAANDPRYIQCLVKADHHIKTNGTKATTAGSDKNKLAKIERERKRRGADGPASNEDFDREERVQRVLKPKLASRPFDKRYRKKLNGRVELREKGRAA